MIERCPCCNAQLKQRDLCPRCQANLKNRIDSEIAAKNWLSRAMALLMDNDIEQSSMAINKALQFKKLNLAVFFREFLIDRQSRDVLDLLAETKILQAKQRLYQVRQLMPYSQKLQQLDAFSNYLLIKQAKENMAVNKPEVKF